MTIELVLSPRDGLTLKDARGFDFAGGVTAGGLPWPGPATTAGAARAMVGRLRRYDETYGGKDSARWSRLLDEIGVYGPVMLSRPLDRETWSPLWPHPQDALRWQNPKTGRREPDGEVRWLQPRQRDDARWRAAGLWGGADAEIAATESLWLPYPDQHAKPLEPRALWSDEELIDWLRDPRTRPERPAPQPIGRLDVHLAVDPATLAAKDEHLFAHFTYEPVVPVGNRLHELGIGLRIDGPAPGEDLTRDLWRIGGEGRFADAHLLPAEVLAAPERLARYWADSERLRLMLVTPARFATGWRPDWLDPVEHDGATCFEGDLPSLGRRVALRAAFVDRAWWTSGWDLALRKPKPSQPCVAAGTVYYLESLAEPFTADDVRTLWLSCIQRPTVAGSSDGFGLVVPGAWPVTF